MKLIILFLIFFGMDTFAKTIELKQQSRSIIINERSGWKLSKNILGMPFIYISPKKNGQRSNISFTDTGSNLSLNIKSLALGQGDYQLNKKEWAKGIGATKLNFFPYTVKINKHGHKIHEIGLTFEEASQNYKEKSHYIECRGNIFFSKSLRLLKNVEHENDFDDIINNLDCSGI
jgi:hypothetical protein